MALELLETNIVLDVYDHDGTRPSIKSIALDDNTRYVFARLTYQGETYDIGSTATVKLVIIRPDKVGAQIVGESKEIQIGQEDESVITVHGAYAELDQPAIAVAGTLLGQFIITSGNQILRSQIFAVNNGEALDSDTWAGQYDGYNLDELVQNVNESVAKVDAMESDVDELKSGFNDLDGRVNRSARVLDSDSEADFDIADSQGNVILRLADGEIETKNFKSSETLTMSDLSDLPEIKDSETQDPNFDIADAYGNVIARVENGEFETKNFRGFQYRTYKSEPQIYSGTLPFTLTVNHHFKKGDRIVLHVDLDTAPWNPGRYVNYYVGNKKILTEGRGDNAWFEYRVTEDVDSVSAVYTGAVSATGMNSGLTFTLEVSLLGDIPITPTVVTVKQDGSGDFTTLRGALDSIGFKANDVFNPYRVEIYPGTYDVLADYTDEEIEDAQYNLYHFVGPVLYNGVSLVGMGNNPEETVLTASLDPTKWSDTIRGVVSTLNCQGSCGFENMTVKAYNLRYCVHDDYTQPFIHRNKRIVKNVIFRGYDVAYTPCTTYGAGTRYSTGVYIFENCDFGENAGLHTSDSLLEPVKVHLINCVGHGFRIGDNVQGSEPGNESEYRFDNCDFLWINQNMVGSVPHVVVHGSGGRSPLYQFDAQTLYATGDVVIVPNRDKPTEYSGVGTVLEWFASNEHGPRFRPASSYDTARGIVVWEDSEDTYIQTKGYVRTDRTGITSFSLGDYVGVVNGVAAIVSDANTAIGQIDYIDNTGAGYIKLNWR